MAIDWRRVGPEVTTAVMMVLGNSWQTVSNAAGPQIQAMVSIGQGIEQSRNAGKLTELEYNSLQSMQKNALEGILSSYEAVGIVVAQQAAEAAWNVITQALVTGGAGFP